MESTRREGKVNIALAYYSLLKSSCEESSHARPTFITLRSLDSRSKSDAVERASSRNCGAHWELLLLFYFAYTERGGSLSPFPMFDPESGRGAHFRRKLRNIFSDVNPRDASVSGSTRRLETRRMSYVLREQPRVQSRALGTKLCPSIEPSVVVRRSR